MRKTIPSLLLALSLAGTFGLAGCGGDDDETGSSDETPSATETEDTTAEDSEPAAPADTETEDAEPSAEEGDGDKPSREDVISGYEEIITTGAGSAELPEDIVTETATCFVDELYDAASAQTLQAIADANAAGIDPDDASLFGDAGAACAGAGLN